MPPSALNYDITATPEETSEAVFEYANASNEQKVYEIHSSNPAILKIADPFLSLQGKEKGIVKMHVAPMSLERQLQVFVFVADTVTRKTDSFSFSINYY